MLIKMIDQTIGALKALIEDLDDDTPLIVTSQPNYPITHTLAGIVIDEGDVEEDEVLEDGPEQVILVVGSDIGYGRKDWWY